MFTKFHQKQRNYYTHRNSNKLQEEDPSAAIRLHYHTEAIILLCYGAIGTYLGFDNEFFIQQLKKSHHKEAIVRQIRRQFTAPDLS